MGKYLLLFLLSCTSLGYCQVLDFETAWQRILCHAPSLAAAEAQIGVLEGEAKQVSLMLNPLFEVESENLGISRPNEDTEPPQTTFSLSQIFELGGKRWARFAFASSLKSIAYWDAQIERADRLFSLKLAFIEVKIAQEKLCLAIEKEAISERILKAVKKQIQNGKVTPIQEQKMRIELMAEKIAVREAVSNLEQAKTRLALMWGSGCPDFDDVEYELSDCLVFPCQAFVLESFYQSPDYRRAEQMICSAVKNLSLQKVNGIPDLTLSVGYRVFHDSNKGGWVVGAAMPLPILNRNQGSVRSAECELTKAEYQLEEIIRDGKEKVLNAYQKLSASYEQTESLRCGILKDANEIVNLTKQGYQNGKLDYFELLETEKMFFDIQEKYLEALTEYHLNRAELTRLTGINL